MSTITIDAVFRDHGATAGMDKLGATADKSAKRWQTFGKVSTAAVAAIGAGMLAAGAAVVKFGAASVKSASDLNETMNKSSVIFGKNQKDINAWASNAAKNLGLSKQAAMASAASFGQMFMQLGFAGKEATNLSMGVVKLSADLGSFNNLPTADVSERIAAAFRGEYDSLQQLVPTISAATVEKQALATTGKKSADALTAEEKAAAVLKITMDSTKQAQGDFARTSDDLANKQKTLAAQFENLKAKLGTALLPAVTAVATAVGDMFDEFEQSGAIDDAAAALKDFSGNLDPQEMSDAAREVVTLAIAFGEAATAISDFNAELTAGQGGGLQDARAEFIQWKATILGGLADVAGGWAKINPLMRKPAAALREMSNAANTELAKVRADFNKTRSEIQNKKIIAKLTADRHDQEKKVRDAKRELRDPDLTKTRKAELKAEIAAAMANLRRIKGEINSIRGKTVHIRTIYSGINTKNQGAPFHAYGGPIFRQGGGTVPGQSPTIRSDNVPAMLTAGEFVMQVPATRFWGGGFMEAVNSGDLTQVRQSVGGGSSITYIINAPNYVGSNSDLVKALTDLNRQGRLEVIRR